MTTPTNDNIRIGISVVSEGAGVSKTQKDLADVRKRIAELKNEFKSGAKDVNAFEKELKDLEAQAKKLDKALDAVGEKRRIDLDSGELVDVTKKSGAEGLRTLGRDIRGLPSVQVPGLGIGTDTFGRAAEVLGRIGVGFKELAIGGGLAIGAVAALAIAIKVLGDSAKEQARVLGAVADANQKAGEDIAQGLTSDQARQRLEEIARLREEEAKNLDRNQGALQTAQDDFAKFFYNVNSGSDALSNAVLGLSPQAQELQSQITEGTAAIEAFNTEENALNAALEDGALAANDAAAAHRELTQQLLTDASQTGEIASLKERAKGLTQEQIDTELEALERRRVGVEAELAALEASGNTSEEVAQKIAQLKDQLGFLGEQSDVLKNARRTARSSEAEKAREKAEKERERAQEKAAKDAQKRAEDAAKAQQDYNDKLRDATQNFRDAIDDINQGLKDDLIDNQRQFEDDLNEQTLEFHQDQLKEDRTFRRELAQISRDAEREERDAVRVRDFAAAAAARERAAEAIDDRKRAEAEENAEQLDEFQQQRVALGRERDIANRESRIDAQRAARDAKIDRDRAFRDARQDLNDFYRDRSNQEQTFMRSSLGMWDNYFNQVLNKQGQATGSRPSQRGSFSSGDSVSLDQMQHIFNTFG